MMRISVIVSSFLLIGILYAGSSVMALQSGGVEIGDLETGSVTGQAFKALDVDLAFTAIEVGGKKSGTHQQLFSIL
jgi:hypothetical protein